MAYREVDIVRALRAVNGNRARAAKLLKCDVMVFYRYFKRNPGHEFTEPVEGRPVEFPSRKVMKALRASKGCIRKAARSIGSSHQTVWKFTKADYIRKCDRNL